MAKKLTKRKQIKENNIIKNDNTQLEYNGYYVGQKVYCYRFPDKKLGYGEISEIFKSKTYDFMAFSFYCQIACQSRVGKIDDIIQDPPNDIIRKKENAIAKLNVH